MVLNLTTRIMKLLHILPLLIFSLFFLGCASSGGSKSASGEEAAATEDDSGAIEAKTAYEGSTGTGLLMERYKSGQIEGYRD